MKNIFFTKHKVAFIIGIVYLVLIVINNVHSVGDIKQTIPLLKCIDYDYQMEFNELELPVEIEFYQINNGEEIFFKREIANEKFETTHLHCGYDYKVVYLFKDYEPFIDYVSIPEVNPVINKVTKISVK